MKISDLIQMDISERPTKIYAVEVDDYVDSKIDGVSEIGLTVVEDDGAVDYDVLDTAISIAPYCKVFLEVPFDCDISAKEMVLSAMNSNCDISLLPPAECTEETWDQFADKMIRFFHAWMDQPRNEKMVYPIASYYQYLIMAENGYTPESIASDGYIKSLFVDGIDEAIMDKAKDKLREVIYEQHGGYEGFKTFVHSCNVAYAKTLVGQK